MLALPLLRCAGQNIPMNGILTALLGVLALEGDPGVPDLSRERDELVRTTRENLINALLPALDNLERALGHSPDGTPLHDGLLQVQKQFSRSLADFGLVEIVVAPGAPFDPTLHEAISHIDSPHPEGAVVEQLQSAYKLGDRLLRPARVVVSKGSPAAGGTVPA